MSSSSTTFSEDIATIISNIRKDKYLMTKEQLKDKYIEFQDAFRQLFDIVIQEETTEIKNMLDKMLKVRSGLDRGDLDQFDADVLISSHIADKYLYKNGIKKPEGKVLAEKYTSLRQKYLEEKNKKPIDE